MKRRTSLATMGGAALLGVASLTLGSQVVTASDHADAPLTEADAAADIADFYVWNTATDGTGNIVMIMTYSGGMDSADEPVYDRDVLYGFHVDFDEDGESDHDIWVRFGQNELEAWGVQFEGLPGAEDAAFNGPVAQTLENGDATAHVGLFDDPFFFDREGFEVTLENLQADDDEPNDLAFGDDDGLVDAYAGTNAMAIVIEFPTEGFLPVVTDDDEEVTDHTFSAWVTTARITE